MPTKEHQIVRDKLAKIVAQRTNLHEQIANLRRTIAVLANNFNRTSLELERLKKECPGHIYKGGYCVACNKQENKKTKD
jgi:chromosome segregation ATPase